jgi:spore maturation protein CgeB
LSGYSDDLAELFVEGVEAEFFRDKDEMLDKINFYIHHDEARKKIALAGYDKVYSAGHDIDSRLKKLMNLINSGL